jgi:MFS family permease
MQNWFLLCFSRTATSLRVYSTELSINVSMEQVEVVLMILLGVATEFGYITLLYSLPHYASFIGLSPQQGSVTGALLKRGLGVGRPVVGFCSDFFGRRINIAMSMTALCSILCLGAWVPAKSYACLLLFAVLSGMVCGTFWYPIGPVTVEVVGLRRPPLPNPLP